MAYVYDEDGRFAERCNTSMVALEKVLSAKEQEASVPRAIWHKGQADEVLLKKLIEDQHKWTGSLRARDILDRWSESRGKFVKVFPHEYKRALGELQAAREAGDTIAKARASDKKAVPAK
jgi:glutamate synthase domain-containing protein 3